MNKLHNALKTLNLTLEQRNELVKVLGELGGGGECLELDLKIEIIDDSQVLSSIGLNGYYFNVGGVNSANEYYSNTTNDILKNILNINDLTDIFKYNHVKLKLQADDINITTVTGISFIINYDMRVNGTTRFDTIEIISSNVSTGNMSTFISLHFSNNTNKAEIEMNSQIMQS